MPKFHSATRDVSAAGKPSRNPQRGFDVFEADFAAIPDHPEAPQQKPALDR